MDVHVGEVRGEARDKINRADSGERGRDVEAARVAARGHVFWEIGDQRKDDWKIGDVC